MRTFTSFALIAAAVLLASATTAEPNAAEYKDTPSDYGQVKDNAYGGDAVSPDYQDKNDYGNDNAYGHPGDVKDNYQGKPGAYGQPKVPCPDDKIKGGADVSTYGDHKDFGGSDYPEGKPVYAPMKDYPEYDAPHYGGGGEYPEDQDVIYQDDYRPVGGDYPEVIPINDDVYGPPMPIHGDDYGKDAYPWDERPRFGRRPGRRPRRKVCKCVDRKGRRGGRRPRRRPRRGAKNFQDDYKQPYGDDGSVKDYKESAYPTKPVAVDDYAKTAYPEGGAQPAHYQNVDDTKSAY